MNRFKPPDSLPEPPDDLKKHSDRLVARIVGKIERQGPIPFSEFMEMALYEPGLGYYSAGLHKFGREGDFVTAPELGDVFAACLARQIEEISAALGEYDILEIGAGSGRLAAQLLSEPAVGARSYRILEVSADLRAQQKATIESGAPEQVDRVEWLDAPPDAPWQGVVLANEVVDALPVERFRICGDDIRQVCVDVHDGALVPADRPAPTDLESAVRDLGPLPDGYCSEINLHITPWLSTVTERLERGVALFIDYGYPRSEYYLPERHDGTVIANYRHRAHGNILFRPGLQDITAFVDFTALAEAGAEAGLSLLGYTSQALFLMACGLDEAVQERLTGDAEHDINVTNEVRQLVMPGLMGEKFQVMAMGREWPGSLLLRGFSFRDLSERL